ncbi:DUF998 domain-containing protein [Rhodanobacter sp. Col0626]|uniref:DUF998 domain-containing protein n=1 Tax=Rhodanobacter sp. Col0626 TaxID=3415679 RepID=UPI003CF00634
MNDTDPVARSNHSTVDSSTRRLGAIALAGLLLFAMVAVTVQALRTDLHWQDMPLSFYLLNAYGHWLQAAYFALAIALISLGAGYYLALRGGRRSAAPGLLFACAGIGLCVTALAHSNLPGHAPTLEGFVHGTAAQTAFLCVTVAMLLQSWWLRTNPRWHPRFPFAFVLALMCFAAIWVDALWRGMPRGLEQRLVIVLILGWLGMAAVWLTKPPRDMSS